ncbi:MAG: class I SAM-dependent methyltransferase [Actinomycetota bacterium]|nr:class I SAM-dependent methyltransferase [Actinomycetota bacterium]
MHANSKLLFRKYARELFTPAASVLEIGPDAHPSTYRGLVGRETSTWDTLDLASRTDVSLTFRATSEYSFPVPDDSYDIVLSGQVIEHVRKIWTWMHEVARVCRPGGLVVTINPVSWHYHPAPVDCWRIYPEGMRALCEDAGLEVVLTRFESVELERYARLLPRRLKPEKVFERLSGVFWLLNRALKVPTQGAFDTITVARKPAAD